MNEEAGFIAALLAEPEDRTTLLVYADWLQERNDPRGEYMRLLAAPADDPRRLAELRHSLDRAWVRLVTYRAHSRIRRFKILQGTYRSLVGIPIGARNENGELLVTVAISLWGERVEVDVPLSGVEWDSGSDC